MGIFDGWDEAQERARVELDAVTTSGVTLADLLESTCALELAKLGAAPVTLVEFVDAAVSVLSQFLPVEACSLAVVDPELPPVAASFGSLYTTGAGAAPPYVTALHLHDRPSGMLALGGLAPLVATTGLVEHAAAALRQALTRVLDEERRLRARAADDACRAAAAIDDWTNEQQLDAVVRAAALLPGATGATLEIDDAGTGETVASHAGRRVDRFAWERAEDVDDGLAVRLRIQRAEPLSGPFEPAERLWAVLSRAIARAAAAARDRRDGERDVVTGLVDRRGLGRALASALRRAERRGESVAVVALDVVDAARGAERRPADALMADVASALVAMQPRGVAGRLGLQRAALVLPGLDLLGVQLALPAVIAGVHAQARVDVRAGVAVHPAHGSNPDALVRLATHAAERAAPNHVELADS